MKTNRASLQSRLAKREDQLSKSLSRMLVLLRVLGCAGLSRFLRERINRTLLEVADAVFNLILQNAFLRMTPGNKSAKGARIYVDPRALRAHLTRRAGLGGMARRRMKPVFTQKDFIARIEGLRDLLANKEKLVACLARRFSKGLTRICFAYTRAALVEDACGVVCANAALSASSGHALSALAPDTS